MESNNLQSFKLPTQDLEIGLKLPCFLYPVMRYAVPDLTSISMPKLPSR